MSSYTNTLPPRAVKVLSAMTVLSRVFTDVTALDVFDHLEYVEPHNQLSEIRVQVTLTDLKNWKLVKANGWTSASLSCRPRPRSRLVYAITDKGRRLLEVALEYERLLSVGQEALCA